MPRNRELTGRFDGEWRVFGEGDGRTVIGGVIYANDSSTEESKVKGHALPGELQAGLTYRFFGLWRDTNYGRQFFFSSFALEQPCDDESFIAYLQQAKGTKLGSVTERVASVLVEQFGDECIETVINYPIRASDFVTRSSRCRWSHEAAAIASRTLKGVDDTRKATLGLMSLFDGRGFPKKTPRRAIRAFGTDAATIIRDDVFGTLMSLPGIGFKGADKVFCDVARERTSTNEEYQQELGSLIRQAYCVAYEVMKDRTGSTWVTRDVAYQAVYGNVASDYSKPEEAIAFGVLRGVLAESYDGKYIALASRAENEMEVVRYVNDYRMRQDDLKWPDPASLYRLSVHQVDQLRISLSARMGLLQGSPGCGKTFVIGCLVKAIIQQYGEASVAVACPTGKASVRATAAMTAEGVPIVATTIHRLLGVESNEEVGGWTFCHNEGMKLPHRFLIIDEPSMIDTDLMAALLRACSSDVHVLMCGDKGQLAPVGHGLPFADMQGPVRTGHLTEIRRNSGRIVKACAEIRDHQTFTPSTDFDEAAGENLPWIEMAEGSLQDGVLSLVSQFQRQSDEVDPVWDVQLITACNKNSPVSRRELNPIIQKLLNPHGEEAFGCPFRVGDKLVCLSNGRYWCTPAFWDWLEAEAKCTPLSENSQSWILPSGQSLQTSGEKHECYVANGELAKLLSIDASKLVVELFDPRRVVSVPWRVKPEGADDESDIQEKGVLGDWDWGYVLSCHKSQGSQWRYVIVIIDPSGAARTVMNRQWIFTGLSRASDATFGIGEIEVARNACARDGLAGRKTLLREGLIRESLSQQGLFCNPSDK